MFWPLGCPLACPYFSSASRLPVFWSRLMTLIVVGPFFWSLHSTLGFHQDASSHTWSASLSGYLHCGIFGHFFYEATEQTVSVLWTIKALQRFEWILNFHKSVLVLTYCLEYLGLLLDTTLSRIFLPQEKLQILQSFTLFFFFSRMRVLGLLVTSFKELHMPYFTPDHCNFANFGCMGQEGLSVCTKSLPSKPGFPWHGSFRVLPWSQGRCSFCWSSNLFNNYNSNHA